VTALPALLLLAALSAPEDSLQRFGLFIGANDGGAERIRLRYAGTDAQSMARILQQFGGLGTDNAKLLLEPDVRQLESELERVKVRVSEAKAVGKRTELIVYYSGHADESGLLLSGARLSYQRLRDAIDQVPADVRVAILDSCHAGSFVRLKGGRRIAPFLVDASSAVKGYAFLTSSSATEAAQESDGLRSSYFTFALLSALRGAADTSRDGRVTLTEAYQFAFQETLAHTEKSPAGPQHPAYDIHLAGTGDLVMTDLRGRSAGLVIPSELHGHVFVRDDSGHLVAELNHMAGHPLELGLEPGQYTVRLEMAQDRLEAQVSLAEGKRVELQRTDFRPAAPGERVAIRGGDELEVGAARRVVPFNVSLFHPLSVAGNGEPPVSNFSLSLLYGRIAELRGVAIGLGLNMETERMQGVQYGGINWVNGNATGLQWAFLFNLTSWNVIGVQEAFVFNQAGGILNGVQLAYGVNIANEVGGLQISYAANIAGNIAGGQVAAYNQARLATGAQLGVVNVALQGSSFQLGAVNVGGSVNVPIGLVNVANDADAPVGVVNWIRNGYRAIGLWGSDIAPVNVGVKLGGRYSYSLLAAGAQPLRSTSRYFPTFGFGLHFRLDHWSIDTDATASMAFTNRGLQSLLPTALRCTAILPIRGSLSLTMGIAWNIVVGWNGADADLGLFPQIVQASGKTKVRQFPGFALGLQF